MSEAPQKILYDACHNGDVQAVYRSVALGADLHKRLDNGATPLMVAVECGHERVVQALCGLGADLDVITPDSCGFTPLQLAASKGHERVVRALCELRSDPNVITQDAYGYSSTPLHLAIDLGYLGVVRALLAYNADPNVIDGRAVSSAAENDDVDMVRLLLNYLCKKDLFKENLSRNEAYLPILKDLLDIATTDPLSENLLSCLLTEPYRSYYLQSELKAVRALCESVFDACSQGVYPEGWLIGDVISLKVQAVKIVVTHLPQEEWTGNYLPEDLEELCFAYYFLMHPEETNGEKALIEEIQSENVSLEKIKILLELSQRKLDVYLASHVNVYFRTAWGEKINRTMYSHLLKLSLDLKKTAVRDVFVSRTPVLNEICRDEDVEVIDTLLNSATEKERIHYCERINSTSSDYGRFFNTRLTALKLRENAIKTNGCRLVL